jgi:hypothetical protein
MIKRTQRRLLALVVFDVFADDKMQQKTQEALEGGFSEAEREKIQLLHLSKLSELIYTIVSVEGGMREYLPTETILS